MRNSVSSPEAQFREYIKQQLDQKELDTKKAWKNPAGPFFKKLKAFYYITAVFSFLVFSLNELIFLLMFGVNDFVTDEQRVFFAKNHWVVHSLFVLSVVAFIIMLCKKTNLACRIQPVAGALVIFQTFQVFTGLYTNQTMLGVLYLVALLPTLFVMGMLALHIAYEHRLKVAIEKEIQALYHQSDDEFDLIGADQWEGLLEKYIASKNKSKPTENNEE